MMKRTRRKGGIIKSFALPRYRAADKAPSPSLVARQMEGNHRLYFIVRSSTKKKKKKKKNWKLNKIT